jgi:hypothetical protein
LNNEGKTPEQMTSDDTVAKLYQIPVGPLPDATENHFVGKQPDLEPIEWLDSYRNAYRISFENHQHMKRWSTKLLLKKLIKATSISLFCLKKQQKLV